MKSANDKVLAQLAAQLMQNIEALNAEVSVTNNATDIVWNGFITFTQKELNLMPTPWKKTFRIEGMTVQARCRTDRRYKCSIEIRYRRHGYNISASGRTEQEAKENFIHKLHVFEGKVEEPTFKNFHQFAMEWFEKFHKRKVKPRTYECDLNRYKNHIRPPIGNYDIKSISPVLLQRILDKYEGTKTGDEIYSLLNQIFNAAIKFNLITHNPLGMVFHRTHERQHGKALTHQEERYLMESVKGTKYEVVFAVALYTGIRPNEYKTAKLENGFIVAVNSKQKDGKVHYKKIPVCPMLAPYLTGVSQIKMFSIECTRDKLRQILPEHILYDLRTTFYTRCQECGVTELARNLFVGHSLKGLAGTYTDISDEYLIKEAQKIKY